MLKKIATSVMLFSMVLVVYLPTVVYSEDQNVDVTLGELVEELDQAIADTSRLLLRDYLQEVRENVQTYLDHPTTSTEDRNVLRSKIQYALHLARDAMDVDSSVWSATPFLIYDAPALSPLPRLPDVVPEDGKISDELSIISAQNEYEAASFVIAPLTDATNVTFTVSELQGEHASIPSSAIDLRVVKTWYQGSTGWQSYFFDDTKSIYIPELLLHDETLILSDHDTKRNYVRVDRADGSEYVDISGSPPADFSSFVEPVEDSPVLLPIELKQGESKQMWLTSKVPSGTPEGVYTGTIGILIDGEEVGTITLQIRVLPFELPQPKTYYDLDKDFYVMIYHSSRLKDALQETGGDTQLAETRLLNQYKNLVRHNVVNMPPNATYELNEPQVFLRQLELMEQAGMDLDPLFGIGPAFPSNEDYPVFTSYLQAKAAYDADPTPENEALMQQRYEEYLQTLEPAKDYIDEAFSAVTQAVGHTNVYFDGWDEADWNRLQWQQELWRYIKEEVGAKIFATGHASHLDLEVKEDFLNWSSEPTREKSSLWHDLGDDKIISSYAYPHSGPENPDLMRQRHGMWLYKANYDATYNYIWYFESPYVNPWSEYIDATFRAFNFVYPTQTDVIDTIAWEGFREGIDDIRYATKLKQLAEEALHSGVSQRITVANEALNWLEETDERSTNADLLRLEMIHYIMHLLELEQLE